MDYPVLPSLQPCEVRVIVTFHLQLRGLKLRGGPSKLKKMMKSTARIGTQIGWIPKRRFHTPHSTVFDLPTLVVMKLRQCQFKIIFAYGTLTQSGSAQSLDLPRERQNHHLRMIPNTPWTPSAVSHQPFWSGMTGLISSSSIQSQIRCLTIAPSSEGEH